MNIQNLDLNINFRLHEQLAADTHFIQDLTLSRLLLMNDKRYPWLILVPKRNNISELFELNMQDQHLLWDEISIISKFIKEFFTIDKLNIASLGNIVSQLHVHLVGRKITDEAWPKPVWGIGQPIPYSLQEKNKLMDEIKNTIKVNFHK